MHMHPMELWRRSGNHSPVTNPSALRTSSHRVVARGLCHGDAHPLLQAVEEHIKLPEKGSRQRPSPSTHGVDGQIARGLVSPLHQEVGLRERVVPPIDSEVQRGALGVARECEPAVAVFGGVPMASKALDLVIGAFDEGSVRVDIGVVHIGKAVLVANPHSLHVHLPCLCPSTLYEMELTIEVLRRRTPKRKLAFLIHPA
mmetsp:Transcript_51798/g.149371  ORF Transcript_51798/g.149371 Transcript_51798/m.149371 type:complete len:200 (-) Transcript_51798:641-1240(-)